MANAASDIEMDSKPSSLRNKAMTQKMLLRLSIESNHFISVASVFQNNVSKLRSYLDSIFGSEKIANVKLFDWNRQSPIDNSSQFMCDVIIEFNDICVYQRALFSTFHYRNHRIRALTLRNDEKQSYLTEVECDQLSNQILALTEQKQKWTEYRSEIQKHEQRLQEYRNSIEERKSVLSNLEESIAEMRTKCDEVKKKINASSNATPPKSHSHSSDRSPKDSKKYKSKYSPNSKKDKSNDRSSKHRCKDRHSTKDKTKQSSVETLDELRQKCYRLQMELYEIEHNYTNRKDTNDRLLAKIRNLKLKKLQRENENKELQLKIRKHMRHCEDMRNELRRENHEMESDISRLRFVNAQWKGKQNDWRDEIAMYRKETSILKSQKKELQSYKDRVLLQLRHNENEKRKAIERFNAEQKMSNELKAENKQLKEKIAKEKETQIDIQQQYSVVERSNTAMALMRTKEAEREATIQKLKLQIAQYNATLSQQ